MPGGADHRRYRAPSPRRSGELVSLLVLVIACVAVVPAPDVAAAVPSWRTGTVRFEPSGGAAMVVDGLGSFRGTIELRRDPHGVTIVNEVGFEDYVRGIQEVPAGWPEAAQQSQAIAARTFALHTMLVRRSSVARAADADICATQACQVYRGLQSEQRPGGARWLRAVDATAGRVLLHRGAPILAKYSSSNGGRSDAGGAPYLPAVDDPDDLAVSPWARWRSVLPLAVIARALPGPGDLVELNRAGDVVVARRRQPDGAVVDQGYSGSEFRAALNATAPTPAGVPVPVPSTRFVARTDGATVTLDGGGYGHLLGMSQYGALGKARRGLSADDILASYYGGLRSTSVPAQALPSLVRVVLATGLPEVAVGSAGRFRVVADDGGAIAHLAGGSWEASAQVGELVVTSASPEAASPRVTVAPVGSVAIQVGISIPSRVVVRDALGHARSFGLLDAGVHELAPPAPVPLGTRVELDVEADAGGGRVTRVTLHLGDRPRTTEHRGAGPAVALSGAHRPVGGGRGPDRGPAAAVAAGALAAAAVSTTTSFRRSRHAA